MFYSFGPEEFLDAIIALTNLFYDDYVDCHYDRAVRMFVKHCKKNEDLCRSEALVKNLSLNVFSIVQIGTSIADVSVGSDVQEIDELKKIMSRVGKDMSKLLKLIFGMKRASWRDLEDLD